MSLILRCCNLNRNKQLVEKCVSFYSNYTLTVKCVYKKVSSVLHPRFCSTFKDQGEKELVIDGSLTNSVRRLRIFSLTTSLVTIVLQPAIIMKAVEEDNLASLGFTFCLFSMVAIFTPLFLHVLTKRYVTKMYYFPATNSYCGLIYNFYAQLQPIFFTKADVKVSDISALTTCTIKGNPLLFIKEDFKNPEHYHYLMGDFDMLDLKTGKTTNMEEMETIKEKVINAETNTKQMASKQ